MAKKKTAAKTFSFEVDEQSDVPIWVQLRNRLAHLIDSGYYVPGEQLPTVRALASEISINYNTVNKAYLALKSDGYIESTQGRGAFVRDAAGALGRDKVDQAGALIDDCISACRGLGLTLDEVQTAMNRRVARLQVSEDPASGTIVDFEKASGKVARSRKAEA